jgi:protein-S-isoprenylcysteine O-methyltransferase Ste14
VVVRITIRILLSAVGLSALVIIGYGISDCYLLFASLPRAAFLLAMLIATAGAAVSAKNPTKKGTLTPPRQRLLLASVQAVTLPLLVFLPFADKHGILVMHSEWVRWLGLGTTLAGYAIMLLALRTLGKNYSVYVTIQEQHELVQTGIYSVVRNPIYLGTMLSWPGACLVFRSWLVFPVFLYFLAFGVLRAAQEERVLHEQFNIEFDAYCRRTWRLLPHVY